MKSKKSFFFIITIALIAILTITLVVFYFMKNPKGTLKFSQQSGFYEDAITLKLSARGSTTIYYTTDGSTPTENSNTYKKPLTLKDRSAEPNVLSAKTGISFTGDYTPKQSISKANVIRAFAKFKDGSTSKIITKTYFVGKKLCEKYKNIPVISLSINPEDFFDHEIGIYVRGKVYDDWVNNGGDVENTPSWETPGNFTQTGREWERPTHLELFENGVSTKLSQDLGIRIIGGASRGSEQKSLKFFARKDYDKGSIDYNLFPGDTKNIDNKTALHNYDTFVLRNGGNDSWLTKFRHRYIQLLVADRHSICTQETRPCILFINGEYWGIYTLTDDYSDKYIERNYDIAKDNVVMYKRMLIEEGTEADRPLYDDMIKFAEENNLDSKKNYKQISNMVDIQSFIDYFVTQIYIVNGDWLNHENNYRLWRSRTTSNKPFEDGKWRYMLYDTEYSMGIYSQGKDYDINSLKDAMTLPVEDEEIPGSQIKLFTSLLHSEDFKHQFVNTFMDMLNYNFKKERLNSLLEQVVSEYEPYMQDYYTRFGNTHLTGLSRPMDAFYVSLDEMKLFLKNRNDYIPTMLQETLNLKGNAVNITVSTNDENAGSITINTITPKLDNGTFSGQYFEDIPITLTATPKDGYTFTGWTGNEENKESVISVIPSEAANYQANFTKN